MNRRHTPVRGAWAALRRPADGAALTLVILVAASVRVLFAWQTPAFVGGDSTNYHDPAYHLLIGDGFPLPVPRQPLYPVFIALVARLFGESLENLTAVQHVLGVGTAALTYLIGRLTFGRGAGLFGGLAAALSGGLLIYEHYVLTETLFTFLLTFSVALFLLGLRRQCGRWFVASGLVLGLAVLTRPHAQVMLVLGPLTLAFCQRRWRPVLRASALFLLAAAVVLLPWMARNRAVHGFFAVSGGAGSVLLDKIVRVSGFVFDDPEQPRPLDENARRVRERYQELADRAQRGGNGGSVYKTRLSLVDELGLSEAQVDALMRDAALDAIRANPQGFIRLALAHTWGALIGTPEEFSAHWKARNRNQGPESGRLDDLLPPPTPEQQAHRPVAERLVNLYQSPWLGPLLPLLLLVGLVGALVVPAWRPGLLPGLLVLSYHVVTGVFAPPATRYHYPPDPMLHVAAFGGLQLLGRALARLRFRAPQPTAPAGLSVAAPPTARRGSE